MSKAQSSSSRVAGKVALVTGAGSGIGRATAILLAREGASVTVVDVDELGGKATVEEITRAGGKAIFVKADVGKSVQIREMIGRTEEAFGRLDIIHNNAIWRVHRPATELEEQDWNRTLDVGLKAVYLSAKYGIPLMRQTGQGSIITTGSVHSLVGFGGCTAYDTVKAGILGLTRVLALDYGPDIRVNAVLPGAIDTPLFRSWPAEERRQLTERIPARRVGRPEDIAHAVLFLASDEAAFITGTYLVVDGGQLAGLADVKDLPSYH